MRFYHISFVFSLLACLCLVLLGCSEQQQKQQEAGPAPRRNVVVLLDLSDRLLEDNQAQRDVQIIQALCNAMVAKAKEGLFLTCHDRIQIVVAPQQKAPYELSKYRDRLACDLKDFKLSEKRHVSDSLSRMMGVVKDLYLDAADGEKPSDYAGADIWRYLKERIAFDFADLEGFEEENHLIILTDGYLNFESYQGIRHKGNRYASTRFVYRLAREKDAWRESFEKKDFGVLAFKDAVLSSVHLHVMEVNPHGDYHFEILEATWQQFAQELDAKSFHFYQKGLLETNKDFLLRDLRNPSK